jgi:hypothetical protein
MMRTTTIVLCLLVLTGCAGVLAAPGDGNPVKTTGEMVPIHTDWFAGEPHPPSFHCGWIAATGRTSGNWYEFGVYDFDQSVPKALIWGKWTAAGNWRFHTGTAVNPETWVGYCTSSGQTDLWGEAGGVLGGGRHFAAGGSGSGHHIEYTDPDDVP